MGLMERRIIYYKGKGGGFLQVRAVVSFVNPRSPVALPNTKMPNNALTNLLLGFAQVRVSE
jgi:hypothetical protein